MKAAYRFRIPDGAARLIRGLHPELKQKVRTSLALLGRDPHAGKALQAELEGLYSIRAGRLRIVYRPGRRRSIEIVAIGPRERVYEETLRLLRKKPAGKPE